MAESKLSYETISRDTIWVAKMQGYRTSGTYAEIRYLLDDPDCRDFDLAAGQPEHLRDFYAGYFAQNEYYVIADYYNNVYNK